MFKKPDYKNLFKKLATIIFSAVAGGTIVYQSLAVEICGAVVSEVIAPPVTISETSGGTTTNQTTKPLEDMVYKLLERI